ncbi:hypothetical protein SmJEL517_g02084 [Synchytrium microbalum]|uniref:MHD domain-containing protein n=1 Tax=Synchytrium microbalum TaxID=1806994 RepID=A0A507C360_9FUNG|nr:uncharacterized protein SmJEL517_g02084 [Synchytrium microbalum]TPX35567.1 hypothetical protein SmJEL517_g02084 [Synchytrium microbalum]
MRFVESFSFDKPRESVEILLKRLRKGKAIEEEVADYFRERAQIEERYANELKMLSRKQPATDKEHFGTFAPVWGQVLLATAEVATLHSSLAQYLSDKLDKPLRTRADIDPDWAKLRTYETDFVKRTREYEEKVLKAAKLGGKKQPSGTGFIANRAEKRLNEATVTAEQAKIQWNNEAVQMFERFQRMEENRLGFLKVILTDYATFDAQNAQARSLVPDKTLAMAVSFDVDQEIDQFCISKNNINRNGSLPNISANGGNSRSGSFSRQSVVNGSAPAMTMQMTGSSEMAPADSPTAQVDSEGFTIRPQSTGNNPWADSSSHSAGDEDDTASISSQPRFNFNIKKEAIVEEPDVAFNTMRAMAVNLRSNTLANRGTTRRPDDRPTSFIGFASAEPTPLDELFGSAIQEPEASPPVPPLKVTISETINALLRNGSVDRLLLVGDITIQLPPTLPPPRGTVLLRLRNATSLEKAVPNPTYIRPIDSSPGDYVLSLDALTAAGGKDVPIIKYQVKANAWGGDGLIPFIVTPFWKIEPGSTSLVLAYHHSNKGGAAGITLRDVQVVVNVEGPSTLVFGAVSTKPPGIFSSDRKALLWKLGDVAAPLTEGEEPSKLVAKFDTPDGTSTGGSIAIKFTGSGSILSDIGLEFIPEPGQTESRATLSDVEKKITSGKYGATS